MILSTKTGYCPEDCGYCSQSIDSTAKIEKNTMMSKEEIVAGARRAHELKSGTFCIVASGRGPTNRELDIVTSAVKEIKEEFENMRVCACLGILREGQAEKLKEAGVTDITTTSILQKNIMRKLRRHIHTMIEYRRSKK